MRVTTIENFYGWLSLVNPANLKENQFELLKNMYYNKDKRIQTRRGIKNFWGYIPDAVTLINTCDATTNFVWTLDATTIATWTAIRWTQSLSFMIDVSNDVANEAIVTNASLWNKDISSAKWYLWFWLYVPTWFNTDLTAVKVRLWTDSSNYYEWTLGTLTVASNNFIKLLYTSATTTWSVTDTNIDYFRISVTYAVWYTDKTWVLFDSIYSYSATSSKPCTSYFFFQNDISWARSAFTTAWTNMFLYNEATTAWEVIKTWLSQFESDWTTYTRWSFAVYLNNVYMCNWVDQYTEWNWTTFSDQAAQPKCRYLRYMADSIYWSWADAAPSTVYATAAWAADWKTLNANDLIVWGDELWRVNWLKDLWSVLLIFKNKKIYSVAADLSTSTATDPQNWWYGHRSIQNVENSLMYFSDEWVDVLKPRDWLSWASALASQSKSEDLRDLLNQVTPYSFNYNASFYNSAINNYYFSFDTWSDRVPETTFVYSSLVWSWSQYNLPSLYDYGFYVNSNWNYQYLVASANWWQLFEIESWFLDFSLWIESELKTKRFDFWDIWLWKTFESIDIQGYKNEWSEITVEALIDEEVVWSTTLNDSFANLTATTLSIWSSPIWLSSIWGWEWVSDDIELYPYLIRLPLISSWPNIQLRMYSNSAPQVFTLDKIKIVRWEESLDVFPESHIG